MLRKKIAVLIAAVMTAQMSVPAFALEYSDVPRDHWAYSEIQKAGEIGFMSGMGDGTFGLGQNVTRAQFVSMLVRMFGWSASEGTGFSDVAPGDWYYSDVLTASDMGVLDTTETYFRPNDNITREEMAVMIIKALGYGELAEEIANDGVPFSDVTENKGYISLAYEFGIISGRGGSIFDPNGTALREDAAAMMVRCYDKYNSYVDFVHGFYAFSSYSQKDMAAEMDTVSFGWSRMEYSDEDGVVVNTTTQNDNEWNVPEGYTDIVEYLKDNNVETNLNVYMSASESDDAETILSSAENRTAAVNAIIEELTVDYKQLGYNPYSGVTIDFENLRGSEMRQNFTAFLTELNEELDSIGKSLYVAVQPPMRSGAYFDGYDFKAIGEVCDKIIVMAYDYYAKTITSDVMESGFTTTPVTPFDEVYYALKVITDENTGVADKSKVVLGLSMSNVGWTVVDGVIVNSTGKTYTYEEIADMINNGAEVKYSDKYKNPYIVYDDGEEKQIIWYEDETSVKDKIKLAEMFGIDGISVWRIGLIPEEGGNLDIWSGIT
ncbi:MAG: S-layer homology domain-containing protein, partial [Eubacteriales bacterium]|nr:S-layer homology domain-containing protein [Eubacteriales bacterium]